MNAGQIHHHVDCVVLETLSKNLTKHQNKLSMRYISGCRERTAAQPSWLATTI